MVQKWKSVFAEVIISILYQVNFIYLNKKEQEEKGISMV